MKGVLVYNQMVNIVFGIKPIRIALQKASPVVKMLQILLKNIVKQLLANGMILLKNVMINLVIHSKLKKSAIFILVLILVKLLIVYGIVQLA